MPIGAWRIDAIPNNTRTILELISGFDVLEGFRLIGGTALALQAAHRQSEDIDLLWPAPKLPRVIVTKIIDELVKFGYVTLLATNENARLYWEKEGADLDDYQQDWMIDRVKLTFFSSESDSQAKLLRNTFSHRFGMLEVIDKKAIFETKSRLLASRTTSRDLFDIWWFLNHDGHTIHEVVAQIRQANPHYSDNMIRGRLLPFEAPLIDPGIQPLIPGAPADFNAVREALRLHVAEWDIALAIRIIIEEAKGERKNGLSI